jgi:hypothetical protein
LFTASRKRARGAGEQNVQPPAKKSKSKVTANAPVEEKRGSKKKIKRHFL